MVEDEEVVLVDEELELEDEEEELEEEEEEEELEDEEDEVEDEVIEDEDELVVVAVLVAEVDVVDVVRAVVVTPVVVAPVAVVTAVFSVAAVVVAAAADETLTPVGSSPAPMSCWRLRRTRLRDSCSRLWAMPEFASAGVRAKKRVRKRRSVRETRLCFVINMMCMCVGSRERAG